MMMVDQKLDTLVGKNNLEGTCVCTWLMHAYIVHI